MTEDAKTPRGDSITHFVYQSKPIYPLVICRIVIGSCLFLHYARLLPEWGEIFGPHGLGGAVYFENLGGAAFFGRATTQLGRAFFQFQSESLWLALYILLMASSLSFALGFGTRMSGLISLFLNWLLHTRNEYVFWGWGDLVVPFMLYVVMSDSGRIFSLDQFFRGRVRPGDSTTPAWPLLLLRLHVSTLYFVVSTVRMPNLHWEDGSMVYRILVNSFFSRFPFAWEQLRAPLTALTHVSLYMEIVSPFLLWVPVVGPVVAVYLIFMHLGLEVTTMVGWWNFIVIAALTSFFPDVWWSRLKGWRERRGLRRLC